MMSVDVNLKYKMEDGDGDGDAAPLLFILHSSLLHLYLCAPIASSDEPD
jgi:hypothetical protein